jgi:hypothetical protein
MAVTFPDSPSGYTGDVHMPSSLEIAKPEDVDTITTLPGV